MKEINKFNKLMALLFLMGFIAITSCEQQEDINPAPSVEDGNFDLEGIGESTGTLSCSGNNNVTLNGTTPLAGPAAGQYCPAGRLTYQLCGTAPNLSFEGQFNSFIRPLTGGWFIGTIPLSEYNNSWSNMTITTEASNPGTAPSGFCGPVGSGAAFPAPPTNVVGLDGSIFVPGPGGGTSNYGQGYYNYALGPNIPNIIRAVVVWRGSSATDPAGATEAYAIQVDALNSIDGPDNDMDGRPDFFTSQVIFDYRKAL